MRAWTAFRDALGRVNGAPMMVLGMCAATLLVALPLSFVVRDAIEAHLGRSLVADSVAGGANYDWWQEFTSQASGLAASFNPSIVGFGAVLDNLEALLDNLALSTSIAAITLLWIVVWSFLSGGVLDRLARRRPTRAHGFFAACGVHFWRFARVGLLAYLTYAVLFAYVHPWIFDDAYESLVRDVTAERTGFAMRLAAYILFGALLTLCTMIFDFARVRIVVEDRRSAVAAVVAGARFVRRHAGSIAALYLVNGAAFLTLILVYALVSPGAPGGGLSGWLVLLLGQAYIVARHYLKLVFYASGISLFQSALAHASYTAAPAVVWPDSPSAEAIGNADVMVP